MIALGPINNICRLLYLRRKATSYTCSKRMSTCWAMEATLQVLHPFPHREGERRRIHSLRFLPCSLLIEPSFHVPYHRCQVHCSQAFHGVPPKLHPMKKLCDVAISIFRWRLKVHVVCVGASFGSSFTHEATVHFKCA